MRALVGGAALGLSPSAPCAARSGAPLRPSAGGQPRARLRACGAPWARFRRAEEVPATSVLRGGRKGSRRAAPRREGRTETRTRRQFLRLAWLAASLRARRLREAFTPQPLSRCQTVLFTKAEWPEVPNPKTERRRASPFRRARASRRLGSCSWRRLPRAASRNAYVPQLGPGCLWT